MDESEQVFQVIGDEMNKYLNHMYNLSMTYIYIKCRVHREPQHHVIPCPACAGRAGDWAEMDGKTGTISEAGGKQTSRESGAEGASEEAGKVGKVAKWGSGKAEKAVERKIKSEKGHIARQPSPFAICVSDGSYVLLM
jgi:hypothetical protein